MTFKRGFIDADGRPLRELSESERHAISAVGLQVAKKHTCLLTVPHDNHWKIASGTLVQIGARILVATVKHAFRKIPEDAMVGLYWGEDDRRAVVSRKDVVCHPELDLAVIALPEGATPFGVPVSNVDIHRSCTPDDLFVVSGIPGEKFSIDDATRTVTAGHFSLGMVGLPEMAWPSHIERQASNDVDVLLNYTDEFALDLQGEPMKQINPLGMSGGGIWSVPTHTEGIWSPAEAKLIAVQSGVESHKWRYLRTTRIKHWLQLVASVFPETKDVITAAHPDC